MGVGRGGIREEEREGRDGGERRILPVYRGARRVGRLLGSAAGAAGVGHMRIKDNGLVVRIRIVRVGVRCGICQSSKAAGTFA